MGSHHSHGKKERYFQRLTLSERIQHIILFTSTTLLIFTGFMVYGERWAVEMMGAAGAKIFWWRGLIHRIAAVGVISVCTFHLFYVITKKSGRSWFMDMIPKPKDAVDAFQNVTYMIGLRKERPKMDRFTYMEKLEYFSVYFGMMIVITTGTMLWTEYLWNKFHLDVAQAFHVGEATLAALALIIGHIFSVHFNHHVYPMNKAFLDGQISEELMKEEHALWHERVMKEEAEKAKEGGKAENE
ncbi:MAG: cytochrome b/b6 domain-containing protein [Deltaproteobacteria bacterium]|nr:cytochrome b/b6 domain-containing protein [Deltaproteobacteria bacterium]